MTHLSSLKYCHLIITCLLIIIISRNLHSQIVVPVSNQADLIAKIIVMNKNFNLSGKPITMGILYNGNSKSSVDNAYELKMTLLNKGNVINNMPLNIVLIDASEYSQGSLIEEIRNLSLDILYIFNLRGQDLNKINNLCKEKYILSITADPSYLQKDFTLSFDIVNNSIKIIINLKSMYAEKVDFSSYLLKVAKVINE